MANYFEELGYIPEEELIARRRRAAYEQAAAQFGGGTGNIQKDVAAGIMRGYTAKKNSTVTQREIDKTKLFEKAAATMRQVEEARNKAGKPLSHIERAARFEDVLAQHAANDGFTGLAAELSANAVTRQQQAETGQANLERLKQQNSIRANQLSIRPGQYMQAYQHGNFSPEYQGVFGFLDKQTGDLLAGPDGEVLLKAGSFSNAKPFRIQPTQTEKLIARYGEDAANWPRSERTKLMSATYNPGELKGIRTAFQAANSMMQASFDLMNVLSQSAFEAGGDPTIFDWTGAGIKFLGRVADNVENAIRQSSVNENRKYTGPQVKITGIGDLYDTVTGNDEMTLSLKDPKSFKAYTDTWSEEDFKNFLPESVFSAKDPTGVRSQKELRSEFAALMVMQNFAMMRAREPDSKQFSDQDFKTSMTTSGGNASSMDEFIRVYGANVNDSLRGFYNKWDTVDPIFKDLVGIDPAALSRFGELRSKYEGLYGARPASVQESLEARVGVPSGQQKPNEDVGMLEGSALGEWIKSYIDLPILR